MKHENVFSLMNEFKSVDEKYEDLLAKIGASDEVVDKFNELQENVAEILDAILQADINVK